MSTKFFTNRDANTLLEKFKGVFEHNRDIEFFDALVGYFRASGYFAIRPFLEHVPHIRILVGINVDAVIADYQKRGLLFLADANRTLEEFRRAIREDIQSATYQRDVEEGILQFVEDIISRKIEIRAHPSRNLHAKIYIFRPEGFNEHRSGNVITGSSNLTEAGLGQNADSNYEFNVILRDYDDVKFASNEFDSLWEESVAVLPVEAERIKKSTYLNDGVSPFQLYIKFLIEYFGKSVEFDPSSISDLPRGFMRLSYQVDAVAQGFDLLQRHNGFFLADVVGLGKTVVATLIAKKFFYHNGFPSHISRTLLVVPPSLYDSWEATLHDFGLSNYTIITNGSLHKLKHPEAYDLVIVDEAHKFRNDTAESYNNLQKICKTDVVRRDDQGNQVKVRKKVILVSATPLNNAPEDIRNLVFLFQDAKDSTLEIANLQSFFAARIREYKAARRERDVRRSLEMVKRIYEKIRVKVVSELTVRRTRTDLREHEQYLNDLNEHGVTFPEVEVPRKILYPLHRDLENLYDRTVYLLQAPQDGLSYNRYRAIGFLKPEKKAKYRSADRISSQLAFIIKTLLVKRLDSSFHAFRQSLHRFAEATAAMVTMFENGRIYIAPNLKVSEFIVEDREEDLIKLIEELSETDPTIEVCEPDDFNPGFLEGLRHDLDILNDLLTQWNAVDCDPKFDEFLRRLPDLLNAADNPKEKLVVFSESKETTDYLKKRLGENNFNDVLTVDSRTRKELMPVIKANFDANVPLVEQANDFNIVLSTEVLAEGINLHRSNTVVNYDTPWNSTRLMQRVGRVNRIGSTAPRIYIYNFYPTAKVDNDLELRKRAIMKLQAFHSALGEDSQIYSTEEEIGTFGLFDRSFEEEKDERLAYLMELRKFKEDSPEEFRKIRNLPLRCRVGRKDRFKKQSTICFIRNKRRDAFYFVKPDKELDELTFVETAKQFHANIKEKSIPLHELHHEHIGIALEDFRDKVLQEAASGKVVDMAQGPNERKALSFLDAFLKMDITGEQEAETIAAAKLSIRRGKFAKLQRDVNKLQNSQKKVRLQPVPLLEKLLSILEKYPLDMDAAEAASPLVSVQSMDHLQPEIILSESFADA